VTQIAPPIDALTRSPQAPRRLTTVRDTGDRIFLAGTRFGAIAVVGIIACIGGFLAVRAYPALAVDKFRFLTTQAWEPDIHHFGVAGVLTGTVLIAVVGLVVSTPVAIGLSLFISELAPEKMRRLLISLVDLMAAVPSVVYALWGLDFFQGRILGVARWLATWAGWFPLFHLGGAAAANPAGASTYSASIFVVGLVVSLMIMPIQCSVMREAFSQAPLGEREGAFALGGTRWGMIRSVVLPFGKGGIVGGTMLAFGRALGETIVVYLIISSTYGINWHILQSGGSSISSLIALQHGDADSFGIAALMAAGLTLFALTLLVNLAASAIITRSRSGAQSEV